MVQIIVNQNEANVKIDGIGNELISEMACAIDAFCSTISEDTMLTKSRVLQILSLETALLQ